MAAQSAAARELAFDERVAAQEAIERVYYSHQIGATKPFEEAVPRQLLERKVRTYLEQSAALEQLWHNPITGANLEEELERMVRGTRMPERLAELFAALYNDPVLIRECLVRAVLADRLTRSSFALDPHSPGIDKTAWDEWWPTVAPELDATSVATVASPDTSIPDPIDRFSGIFCAEDGWEELSLDNAPAARDLHTAVWTGSHMLVWGGLGSGLLNTGGRYDPATDSWTPTATADAPSVRVWHKAVWTGSQMLVWGGWGGDFLNTGGRYDPLTDTWSPMSTVGAPSGRIRHTAVWIGSQMVVWGGGTDDKFRLIPVNTGGRYDPTTDSWAPTSLTDAPTARYGHTAVWTGSLMVVWSGYDGDQTTFTGGRYDPTTDSWTPTSLIAPFSSSAHRAVWTGSLMLIWGRPGTSEGGRYDPATDSWGETSITDAPSPRLLHTAVWTGNEMVIWGGRFSGVGLDTGGRYDPATDTWTATSTFDAPEPRESHTAVWTGSQMLVWGGSQVAVPKNDGGAYSKGLTFDDDRDGYSECDGDCNDLEPAINPQAVEQCNAIDDNCNALVDEDELGEDSDGDRIHNVCDNCVSVPNPHQGPAPLGQEMMATDAETFSWPGALDIVYVSGPLAAVSTYATDVVDSLPMTTDLTDSSEPDSGAGFYYLVRPDCSVGSWQTTIGAESERDVSLP